MTVAALAERWAALPANARGAVWVLLASAGFSFMAALVKLLSADLNSFQIAFFRCAVGLCVTVPLVAPAWRTAFRTQALGLHLGRAVAGISAISCGFYAFAHLPLATATAITFTKPLFMIVLAVLFLGETVRWRRWAATLVGFGGVLIMLRPGVAAFDPAMLVSLAQALSIAVAVLLVKRMPPGESTLTVLFYFAVLSTLGLLWPALAVWQTPSWTQLGLLLLMGLSGVAAQAAVVTGYRLGEATAVVPFDYTRLLFAAAFGFMLFVEVPDVFTVLGAAVIVASTITIARHESRAGTAPRPLPDG